MLDPIEEIKNKIDIVDLVSQYVQLKKVGHNFKGLCPFHKEKTPSFIVSPDKQLAYCFGCHKGGDIFKFMMEMERVEFGDALQTLAKRAGVKLERMGSRDKTHRQRLLDMNRKAQELFVSSLYDKQGKKALEYLKKRGLTEEQIKEFGLGYASDSFDLLYKQLMLEGYGKKEIVENGLATLKEFHEDSLYDKFRNRIMFPIKNIDGEIVAFAGRVMDDSQPKYMNSPETPLYHKSAVLYNVDKAKESIREKDFVLLVEGYMDVISVYVSGISNVVAVCGTALTDEQVKLLKRFTANIYFCFDNDSAGVEAMKRNALPAIRQRMMVKVVPLTEYKDPDEYIQKNRKAFEELLRAPPDLVQYIIDVSARHDDVMTMEGRRKFISEIFPLLRAFPLTVERDIYVKMLSHVLGTTEESIIHDVETMKGDWTATLDEEDHPQKKFGIAHYLIGLLLQYPSFFPLMQEKIPLVEFPTEFLKNIYSILQSHYNNQAHVSILESDQLTAEDKEKVKILLLFIEDQFGEKDEEDVRYDFLKLIERYKKVLFAHQQKQYLDQLRELKRTGAKNEYEQLFRSYQEFLNTY